MDKENEDVLTMDTKELLDRYYKGCTILVAKSQVSYSNLAEDVTAYNHSLFMKCLHRLEAMEDELKKRGIDYEPKHR